MGVKMSKLVTIIILFVLIISTVIPVQAVNLTYPDEYYHLWEKENIPEGKMSGAYYMNGREFPTVGLFQWYELRRQTILMEKQNELIAEQNELLTKQFSLSFTCHRYTQTGSCSQYKWE